LTIRRIVCDHVLFVVGDLEASRRLYEAALTPLGFGVLYEEGDCVGFGVDRIDDFVLCRGEPVTQNAHVAFVAKSWEQVDAFFAGAVGNGAREKSRPALRPEYHSGYYAAFVWDHHDNNVEAVFHGPRE
jgi:catechol 2,3-dioxygenase-like lactoylglutathione lyase family enzyme